MKIQPTSYKQLLSELNQLNNDTNHYLIDLKNIEETPIFSVTLSKKWDGRHIDLFFKINKPWIEYVFEDKEDTKGLIDYTISIIDRFIFETNPNLWYKNISETKWKGWMFDKIDINEKKSKLLITKIKNFEEIYDKKIYFFFEEIINNLDLIFFNWKSTSVLMKLYNIKNNCYKDNKIINEELYKKYSINELIYDKTLYDIHLLKKWDITLLVYIFMNYHHLVISGGFVAKTRR